MCSIEIIVILFKTINLRVSRMKLTISCDIPTLSLCSFIVGFMWKLLGLWRLRWANKQCTTQLSYCLCLRDRYVSGCRDINYLSPWNRLSPAIQLLYFVHILSQINGIFFPIPSNVKISCAFSRRSHEIPLRPNATQDVFGCVPKCSEYGEEYLTVIGLATAMSKNRQDWWICSKT